MQDLITAHLAERYQLSGPQLTHLGTVWNTTYRVIDAAGATYNLRLCNPHLQDRAAVRAELEFLAFVDRRGQLRVPRPIADRGGELVTELTTAQGRQLCCLFAWVEGQEARGRLTPAVVRQIGRAMAQLHMASRAYPFPTPGDGFREGYCYDEELALSHREWAAARAAELGATRAALIDAAAVAAHAALAAVEKSRATYGVIHADFHPGNVIVDGDTIAVIDFDQVGRGHFCYDIALLMVELQDEAPQQLGAHWESFRAGYREVAPLPYAEEAELEPFALAIDLVFLDAYYNSWTPEGRARHGHRLEATYESIRGRVARLRAGQS